MTELVEFSKRFYIQEDDDGDFHIVINDTEKNNRLSFEFCTHRNGGGNREIYRAVRNLKKAIDNHRGKLV